MKQTIAFFRRIGLVGRIIAGLLVGTAAGLFLPQMSLIALPGTFFINALKSVAPVLVFLLVMSALINARGNHGG